MLNRHRIKIQHARSLLPQIEKLAQEERYFESYDLAVQAEKYLKEDSTLLRLMPIISDTLAIITEPAAAHVFLKRFAPDEKGKFPDRAFIGLTPIFHLRIPRGDHKVYFEKAGYTPGECIASSRISRETSFLIGISKFRIEVKLLKAEKVPENMVFVPGGKYRMVGWGSPTTAEIMLNDYFIDKYEVRNEQFRSFIRAGGYSNRQYWKYPFMKDGERLYWEDAMKYFIDRTGLSGPRCWINQNFPEGKGNYPVTDITWYEAAAYAEFSGKSLPTIFQWEKAARGGIFTRLEGAVMPWGLVNPKESSIHRANFEGSGTKPVDSYEFGISPYGCYNMAGNVKEWCLNEMGEGYAITGGCWQDPIYTFSQYGVYPGIYTSNTLGFRCVTNFTDTCGDQGAMKINLKLRTPTYSPVDKAAFKSYPSHYNYDKTHLMLKLLKLRRQQVGSAKK